MLEWYQYYLYELNKRRRRYGYHCKAFVLLISINIEVV